MQRNLLFCLVFLHTDLRHNSPTFNSWNRNNLHFDRSQILALLSSKQADCSTIIHYMGCNYCPTIIHYMSCNYYPTIISYYPTIIHWQSFLPLWGYFFIPSAMGVFKLLTMCISNKKIDKCLMNRKEVKNIYFFCPLLFTYWHKLITYFTNFEKWFSGFVFLQLRSYMFTTVT